MNERTKYAWGGVTSSVVPATMGVVIAILMSYIAANPTWKSWVFWILAYFGILSLAFGIHYWMWRSR